MQIDKALIFRQFVFFSKMNSSIFRQSAINSMFNLIIHETNELIKTDNIQMKHAAMNHMHNTKINVDTFDGAMLSEILWAPLVSRPYNH